MITLKGMTYLERDARIGERGRRRRLLRDPRGLIHSHSFKKPIMKIGRLIRGEAWRWLNSMETDKAIHSQARKIP